MPVPGWTLCYSSSTAKPRSWKKQPEKGREDGNFRHENKHGQEAGKDSQEDHDGSNPTEVTMNGNDLKLFCVLSYLVAISLVGVSVNQCDHAISCPHHVLSCHHHVI